VTCSSCKRTTKAVVIGTGQYCGSCGARWEAEGESTAPVTGEHSVRRTMDVRPGQAQPVATQTAPSARALHARLSQAKGGVLDLSQAKPVKPRAARAARLAVSHTIDHAAVSRVTKTVSHPAPATPVASKRLLGGYEDRYAKAKEVPKSAHVSKFGRPTAAAPTPSAVVEARHEVAHTGELPAQAVTHHEALSRLVTQLGQTTEQVAKSPLAPKTSRYAAIAAVMLIMGGYIWLQNYPKLAIQSAGNRAGLSASIPGYMPSSYSLRHTDTAPGIVTLNFTSPNQDTPLTIEQHRTAWDSNSLLDNYVARQSDDYTAVQGQGLTVYLFNENQAAWVNHGVWYSIAGATRLSREQILKIAYSL
jgi:hypothetical protein